MGLSSRTVPKSAFSRSRNDDGEWISGQEVLLVGEGSPKTPLVYYRLSSCQVGGQPRLPGIPSDPAPCRSPKKPGSLALLGMTSGRESSGRRQRRKEFVGVLIAVLP